MEGWTKDPNPITLITLIIIITDYIIRPIYIVNLPCRKVDLHRMPCTSTEMIAELHMPLDPTRYQEFHTSPSILVPCAKNSLSSMSSHILQGAIPPPISSFELGP